VCRDLDALLNSWSSRPQDTACGVLHVGFDRPASASFEEISKLHEGRVLLTGAAKGALPKGFEASDHVVGEVDGHAIYVATRGWGYLLVDLPAILPSVPVASAASPEGWVKTFLTQHPEAALALSSAGVSDDSTYFANESQLEREIRYRAGLFRYRSLVRPNSDDPCEIVRAAPPWLLDRVFSTIDLTVRVANAFAYVDVKCVRDLLPYDVDGLLRIQNFGRKSVRDLHEALLRALNEGPYDVEAKVKQAGSDKLVMEIERTLAFLDDRERDILKRRMGFGVQPETLHEIGESYGITRERIRQIEAKSLGQILKSAFWDDLLVTKVEALLLGREFPLPVLGLEAVDPWFEGIGKSASSLKYILSNICDNRASIVRIDGIEYVGRVNQDDWAKLLKEARRILATGAQDKWSETNCRNMVESVLNETRREFRGLLWRHASALCHFATAEDGSRVLASYGRGADQVVEAVLLDASGPLHFTEIAERASARSGKDIDIRRAHNAAASIGILLGRGIYGLDHHIKLSDDECEIIRDQLEQIILEGPDDRQWHNSELVSIAAERGLPGIVSLDKYVVDVVLRPSQLLRSLGRMTWSKAIATSGNRIDVRQAIVALLQQAGFPLSSNEIRQRLVALRGVSENFQIYSSGAIVRVDSRRWGLNDRDISLKRSDQPALLEHLSEVLRQRGSGIHLSEVIDAVQDKIRADSKIAPETIFSLASLDVRFQSNLSQYVFLREWSDARRDTLAHATVQVLRESLDSLAIDEIVARVERSLERNVDKRAVVSCLHANDARLDIATDLWSVPSSRPSPEEDLELMIQPRTMLAPIDWGAR
jgi:hypothetical protein